MKLTLALALVAAALVGCTSTPPPPPAQPIPKMGLVHEEVAGQQRIFSTFGFWMLDEPLRKQLLASYTPEGVLDRPKLRLSLGGARIVERPDFVSVTLPSGSITSFLLRDGPVISLDPKLDAMVQQLSVRATTSP